MKSKSTTSNLSTFRNSPKKPKRISSQSKNQFHINTNVHNGVFEIKIESIEIKPQGEKKFKKILFNSRGSLRIVWNFMAFPPTATQKFDYNRNKFDIEFVTSYEVSVNDKFVNDLFSNPLSFKLYAICYQQETYIGKGEVSLKEVLNNPNEIIPAMVEISNLDEVLLKNTPYFLKIFASLAVSFCLKCNKKSICKIMMKKYDSAALNTYMHTFLEQLDQETNEDDNEEETNEIVLNPLLKQQTSSTEVTEEQQQQIESNNTNTISTKKRSVKKNSVNEEFCISTEEENKIEKAKVAAYKSLLEESHDKKTILNYFTKLEEQILEEVSDLKKSLEEYAILSGENTSIIKSPEWRSEHLSKVKYRTYPKKPKHYQQLFSINIHSLKFKDDTNIWKNETIQDFNVEYNFLSKNGDNHKSPPVLRMDKNISLKFGFKKEFPLEMITNYQDCLSVGKMIKQRRSIIIEVVSNPAECYKEVQASEVIGYCQVDLFDLVQFEENSIKAYFDVKSFKNPNEEIGSMRITFSGIQVIRNVALKILLDGQ